MKKTTDYLSLEDEKVLMETIRRSEQETTGEIRLHVEMTCAGDPLGKAREIFAKLGMHRTRERNGILIFIAFSDRKAAIFGDQAIAAFVDQSFWDNELETLFMHFRNGNYLLGMQEVVKDISGKLKEYFPGQGLSSTENPDELSNEISRGQGESQEESQKDPKRSIE